MGPDRKRGKTKIDTFSTFFCKLCRDQLLKNIKLVAKWKVLLAKRGIEVPNRAANIEDFRP